MLNFEFIKYETVASGVIQITLNRPPVNAVDQKLYMEIATAFKDIDALGENINAVVLTGGGNHFCGGNDLDEFSTMTPDNGDERMWRVREAFFSIAECAVPVVAAVHGVAIGTGLAIAASCDIIVAGRNAKFGLPELTVGVMGGAGHLARIASQPLVRRMFFTGEYLSAEQMVSAGTSLIVCEDELVLDEAKRIAAKISGYSPTAIRVGKKTLDKIENMELRPRYEFEQSQTVRMSGHSDSKEALAAFREKRKPKYLPVHQSELDF